MSDLRQVLVLLGFSSVSAACMATTGDESGEHDEPTLGTAHQALVAPKIRWSGDYFSYSGDFTVPCPAGTPYALSGIVSEGDINKMYFDLNDADPVGVHVKSPQTDFLMFGAVCSDYSAPYAITSSLDSDGDHTTSCPSGWVAVGGGGICSTSSAKLTRSRPNPDTAGSEPTGWRATCSTGSVKSNVNCARKGTGHWDWDGCKIRKNVETNDNDSYVHCETGERMVALGSYCANGHLTGSSIQTNLVGATAYCSEVNMTAYAVCCPGVEVL